MKYKISLLVCLVIPMIGCFEVIKHSHSQYALQTHKYILTAYNLQDSTHIERYKEEYIYLMKKGVHKSKYAKRSELNGLYDNWGDMFHDYLIKGAQLSIESELETDIHISLDKYILASEYFTKYGEWFNENVHEMAKKITELKEE